MPALSKEVLKRHYFYMTCLVNLIGAFFLFTIIYLRVASISVYLYLALSVLVICFALLCGFNLFKIKLDHKREYIKLQDRDVTSRNFRYFEFGKLRFRNKSGVLKFSLVILSFIFLFLSSYFNYFGMEENNLKFLIVTCITLLILLLIDIPNMIINSFAFSDQYLEANIAKRLLNVFVLFFKHFRSFIFLDSLVSALLYSSFFFIVKEYIPQVIEKSETLTLTLVVGIFFFLRTLVNNMTKGERVVSVEELSLANLRVKTQNMRISKDGKDFSLKFNWIFEKRFDFIPYIRIRKTEVNNRLLTAQDPVLKIKKIENDYAVLEVYVEDALTDNNDKELGLDDVFNHLYLEASISHVYYYKDFK